MNTNTGKGGTPSEIPITDIQIIEPVTGTVVFTADTGTLAFSDLPVLTIVEGTGQNGGPIGGVPYTITFHEGEYLMHLTNLVYPLNPSPPPPPPYVFTWLTPMSGGISVTEISAFDTTNDAYVILDHSGDNKPTGTFYQPVKPGDNYFMVVKAGSSTVINGGPVPLHNNTIHYIQTGTGLILAEVLYQGQTTASEYIFQQIDGE